MAPAAFHVGTRRATGPIGTRRSPPSCAILAVTGCPSTFFYPAGGNDPVILPSVLTEGIVAIALRGKTSG